MSGPIPTLLLSPQESRDRSGPISPAVSGGVRVIDGPLGPMWQVAESTTNLIPNPNFENGTSGWWGQSGTIARDTTTSVVGSASLRHTATGTTSGSAIFTQAYALPVKPATTYAVSFWIKAAQPQRSRAYHSWRDANRESVGSPSTHSHEFDVGTEWQRIAYTVTTPSDPAIVSTYIVIYANTKGPQIGDQFWVDGVQFEEKPYATPYADGSLGTGYAWTGTPHASVSTRETGKVLFPKTIPLPTERGSIMLRYRTPDAWPSRSLYPLNFGQEGASGFTLRQIDHQIEFWIRDAATNHYGPVSAPWPFQPRREVTVYLEWGERWAIAVDDGSLAVGPMPKSMKPLTQPAAVGSHPDGMYPVNAGVEAVAVFDRPLMAEEREYFTTMNRAWTWKNLVPSLAGVDVSIPADPIQIFQSIPSDPLLIDRSVPSDPIIAERTVPADPIIVTREIK